MEIRVEGSLLVQLRKRRGLTQCGVADELHMSLRYLSSLELGDADNPSVSVAVALAEFYGVGVRFLAQQMGWLRDKTKKEKEKAEH